RLSQFKQTYSGELPQQETALSQELTRLQVQLQGNQDALNRSHQNKMTVESSLTVAQSTEATLKRLMENTAPRVEPAASVHQAGTRKKSEELEQQLAEMSVANGPNHPDIKRLRAAIAQVREVEKKQAALETEAAASGESRDSKANKEPAPVS